MILHSRKAERNAHELVIKSLRRTSLKTIRFSDPPPLYSPVLHAPHARLQPLSPCAATYLPAAAIDAVHRAPARASPCRTTAHSYKTAAPILRPYFLTSAYVNNLRFRIRITFNNNIQQLIIRLREFHSLGGIIVRSNKNNNSIRSRSTPIP